MSARLFCVSGAAAMLKSYSSLLMASEQIAPCVLRSRVGALFLIHYL
jgi:hypothetical protein